MADIVKNDLYNYNVFGINGKHEMDASTSSHVIMANHIRGLGLWHSPKPHVDINRLM